MGRLLNAVAMVTQISAAAERIYVHLLTHGNTLLFRAHVVIAPSLDFRLSCCFDYSFLKGITKTMNKKYKQKFRRPIDSNNNALVTWQRYSC